MDELFDVARVRMVLGGCGWLRVVVGGGQLVGVLCCGFTIGSWGFF